MATFSVSDASSLTAALNSANGGDVIECAAGSYGSFRFLSRSYASDIVVRSANPSSQASFTGLEFDGSSHIKVEGVTVTGSGGKTVEVDGGDHITVAGCSITGPGPVENTFGIYAAGCDNMVITGNNVQWFDVGITVFGGLDVEVTENFSDHVFSDNYKFGSSNGLLVENNIGGGNLHPDSEVHADFMQWQAASSNVTIRGNLYLAQNNERAQGIFLGKYVYTNILIEQNIVYSGKLNAIKVFDGTGIVVRNNTLLATPNLGHPVASILVPSGSTIENNITTHEDGGSSGSNIIAQWDDPNDINYYNDLYVDAMAGLGIQIEDLTPVEGSAAATKGAYARIAELLGSSEPPSVPATITVAVTVGA